MIGNNGKSNENRRKTPELSPLHQEAILSHWPVRHNSYRIMYEAVTADSAARSSVNALGNFGITAEKNYENAVAEKPIDPRAMQEAMRNLGIVGSNDVEAQV